ncbi:MAG TPA: hypothetical protein DCO73_12645, partial [Alphaproteobacteria bacterium]|nr:hypothetical protein [Alphaproteobacteria bacterium]
MSAETELEAVRDQLTKAEAEIRHLRRTIVALREQLEEQRAAQQLNQSDALRPHQQENRQLQGTIAALREQLE